MIICPKCHKKSLRKSETYLDMTLCINKKCQWYMKDDVFKLKEEFNIDDEGFQFQRKEFPKMYKKLNENKELKIPTSIIQTSLFIIDFINKKNEPFIIVIENEQCFNSIHKILKKNTKIVKNNNILIRLKDFNNINIYSKKYLFIQLKKEQVKKIKKYIDPLAEIYNIC